METDVFVEVHVQVLKDDHHVLAEVEAVFELHNAVMPFDVRALVLIHVIKLREELYLNISVINIELFVFANFGSHNALIWISVVNARNDLAKGAFVNDFPDHVPVAQLLAHLRLVESVLVGYRVLILPPHLSNGVNAQVVSKFNLFKLG